MKKSPELQWKSRTRHERTEVAVRQIWETVDGRFRIVKSRSLYGLPTIWYAMRRRDSAWVIISKHQKRATARAAVARFAAR